MRFRFDPEHDELRQVVRRLLESSAGPHEIIRRADDALSYDEDLRTKLATEVGVYSLAVPERFDGAGFGLLELGVVFQEAGYAALGAPLLSVAIATQLLLDSADEDAAAAYLPGIAAGETLATAAVIESPDRWPAVPKTTAVEDGGRWALTGDKDWVIDAATADLFVVSASTPAGPTLFVVEASAEGVSTEAVETIDISRRIGRLSLAAASGRPIGEIGGAAAALAHTHDVALVLLAAEQVGITQRCLEMATAWAKEREQFGRVIGSFQAIKHKLADMYVALELARSNAYYGAWALGSDATDLPLAAATARVSATEAFHLASKENIQTHGGIGFTWAVDCHLFYRRSKQLGLSIGSAPFWKDRLVDLLEKRNAA
jgi:acyl-CoA dehydrogenase